MSAWVMAAECEHYLANGRPDNVKENPFFHCALTPFVEWFVNTHAWEFSVYMLHLDGVLLFFA